MSEQTRRKLDAQSRSVWGPLKYHVYWIVCVCVVFTLLKEETLCSSGLSVLAAAAAVSWAVRACSWTTRPASNACRRDGWGFCCCNCKLCTNCCNCETERAYGTHRYTGYSSAWSPSILWHVLWLHLVVLPDMTRYMTVLYLKTTGKNIKILASNPSLVKNFNQPWQIICIRIVIKILQHWDMC